MEKLKANREHKDRLFRLIFKEKKALLELYNAVNHTKYTNEDDLEIRTLEDAIYMNMKTDVAFVIYNVLNLYEHQSTWNPNMPLRDFLYFSKEIQGYIDEGVYDVYGSRLIQLPTPKAVVFYNGLKEEPERQILKLSDAFKIKDDDASIECRCVVLNINYGKNKKLMKECKRLEDYSKFISKIRENSKKTKSLEEAVRISIDECIEEGILENILRKQRGEVMDVILTEYNEEAHIANERKWSYEDGKEEGREEGIKIFIEDNLEEKVSEERIKEKLMRRFCLSEKRAEELLEKYNTRTD